jgi:hypothetical protein
LESLQTKKIPIWTILGTQTDQQIASKLQLGLQLDLRQQLEEIQASPNPGFALYQPDQEWLSLAPNLPPLTKRFGEARASAGTQVLLTQRVGNLQKNSPLLTFNERNQQRHACLLGEGLWRWRMVSFLKKQDHRAFDAFVGEICAYLLVKKEGSGLRVQAVFTTRPCKPLPVQKFHGNSILNTKNSARATFLRKVNSINNSLENSKPDVTIGRPARRTTKKNMSKQVHSS